jgi:hypothetical protein
VHEDPVARSPVDDATYDLLIVLVSKLEAIHAHERVMAGDPTLHSLHGWLLDEEALHVGLLVEGLRKRLLGPAEERTTQPVGYGGPRDPTMQHGRSGLPTAVAASAPLPAHEDRS